MAVVLQHLPADVSGDCHDGLFACLGLGQLRDGMVAEVMRPETFEASLIRQLAPRRSPRPSAWRLCRLGTPVLRPLVLNSRPFVADPENWKASKVSDDDTAKLRLEFKRKYPVLGNCEEMGAKPYRTNDIKITKSYRSKRNWQVVQLSMKGCAPEDERGDELSIEWYVISADGKVQYLDSNIHLVDAGDYDNDGKSELIFSIDDYNRGGYKLFYENFKQKAIFEFSYH